MKVEQDFNSLLAKFLKINTQTSQVMTKHAFQVFCIDSTMLMRLQEVHLLWQNSYLVRDKGRGELMAFLI